MDTVGKWIASYLKQREIDTLFTLTGGHIFPVLDGSIDADVRVVDTRHEQAAAFAAEGWALRTGRPGAYVVTAGPGFLNGISGLAHASVTLSPTLCLTGASPITDDDKGAPQELEQLRPEPPPTPRHQRSERCRRRRSDNPCRRRSGRRSTAARS